VLTVERFDAAHDGTIEWIDVVDPTPAELDEIRTRHGLGPQVFDEAFRHAARPTIHRYDDHAYLVVFSRDLTEIDVFLTPHVLVTVRHHDEGATEWRPDRAVERFRRSCNGRPTTAMLLLQMIDELIDGYLDRTDELENLVEDLEDRIFAASDPAGARRPQRSLTVVQQELFGLRRELLQLRRVVMPLREVLLVVSRDDIDWIDAPALGMARELFDKVMRAVDVIDEQRELVGNAVDAHLAVMSNQMNAVMKQLTAWGSIVFGATLVAGIYGMNFEHMPELSWTLGYPMALTMMAGLSVALWKTFRRRDWL
jgi:magnesium transporter